MREFVGIIVGLFAVVGLILYLIISRQSDSTPTQSDLNISCLDGVEYWYKERGYRGVFAVKYGPDGKISLCGDDQ